jgi:hypothetical protein
LPVLRFLQLSDLHLGATLGWLTPERRSERHREQQRALESAITLAIERNAHALLIPGDLFDQEGVDVETLAFAVHAFDRPGCPPVFVSPGNHDPVTTTSPTWNPRLLAARGWTWPAHVHVFHKGEWAGQPLGDLPVTVWGRCFVSHAPAFERPLAPDALAGLSMDPSHVHVAVFHGSREQACPAGQSVTAPFSDDEVLRAPFAYMAVGHYHEPSRLEAHGGEASRGVRLAYAGSTIALSVAEVGSHGVLEVQIETGDGAPLVAVEPHVIDSRHVRVVEVDVTGASSVDLIDRRILLALDGAGVLERDIVNVRLFGRAVRGVRYTSPGTELASRVFSLRLNVRAMRPDYDLEAFRLREPSTTEDRFAQAMLEALDAENDAGRRARILSALYYGLDSFRLRDVAPAYEELDA